MDLQVAGLEELDERVETALDRIAEFRAGTQVDSDAFFSDQFMVEHTSYETFDAFCAQSPWDLRARNDVLGVSRDRLDEYVADSTDFESWEEMKTRAAEVHIVDQIRS